MKTKSQGRFELPHRNVDCRAAAGSRLNEAAAQAGIILNVACGGQGVCGGCAVDLLEGDFQTLQGQPLALNGRPRRVLACQTLIPAGPWRVGVPRHSLIEAGEQVVVEFSHAPPVAIRPAARKEFLKLDPPDLADARGDIQRVLDALRGRGYDGRVACSVYVARQGPLIRKSGYQVTATVTADEGLWHLVALQEGDTTGRHYGAAVDVGTTTVVVALVDLNTGKIVDAASCYNQQIIRCDNVASRISYASTPHRLAELRELVTEGTINRLLRLLAQRQDIATGDIAHMSVSGNTVMMHLLCGVDPAGLGGAPFAPVSNNLGPCRAGQLHLDINPEAFVDISPSAAAYIGGDATSDMYLCGQLSRGEVTAMIDIGTNAEIVIGNRDRAIACAAPAGPAFEGHGLSCGMRAAVGAIDSLAIADLAAPPQMTVIGQAAPTGICGSGLIDFVAQAFKAGILGPTGRFTPQAVEKCPRLRKVRQGQTDVLAYELVEAEKTDDGRAPIAVTERDISALLQAKGVIFAALKIAMKHFGKGFGDIHRFYLAGGFARHIDLDNAVAMGLLPDIPRERFIFVGNGSLGGAYLALVDQNVRSQLPHLAGAPTVIQLNLDPEFMDAYTLAMLLPHG
jgi:uncharacterized 2Fe-2S/4Fe-4S cluster protein (DUF4445 family)